MSTAWDQVLQFRAGRASLRAIPHEVWLATVVIEVLYSLGLVLPALNKPLAILAPVAAVCIAAEMLLFCGLQMLFGDANYDHVIYSLGVAAICAFIAYGRFVQRHL